MPNYTRAFALGGTFFLTWVTENRVPLFASASARSDLHTAFENCRRLHPFTLDAIVLLPDHLHLLLSLPEGDANFSIRMKQIKYSFTRLHLAAGGHEHRQSTSRIRQRQHGVWAKRFWEHTIRDERDLENHLGYIHYNPVKHGLVQCVHAWPYSSFNRLVSEGRYDANWGCQCEKPFIVPIEWEKIGVAAGE